MLIDTHAHLTFEDLAGQVDAVIQRSIEAGVTGWITVGTEPGELERVVALLPQYDNLYGALGYHPHHAKEVSDSEMDLLEKLLQDDRIVAVGETGLDFHYNFSKQDMQKAIFRRHLDIATDLQKPVIVHSRNAFEETLSILDEYKGKLKDVVVHCWSGTLEQTQALLDRGYYISFTGIVTFKKSDRTRECAALVPMDKLMVETDCPFISPEPVRNQRPCEPAMLVHTARKLAEVKSMEFEEFAAAIRETTNRFFGVEFGR